MMEPSRLPEPGDPESNFRWWLRSSGSRFTICIFCVPDAPGCAYPTCWFMNKPCMSCELNWPAPLRGGVVSSRPAPPTTPLVAFSWEVRIPPAWELVLKQTDCVTKRGRDSFRLRHQLFWRNFTQWYPNLRIFPPLWYFYLENRFYANDTKII